MRKNIKRGAIISAAVVVVFFLVYLVLLATAPAVISISIREGVVAQSMLELPRWIVFTLLLCAAAALWRKNKALLPVVLLTAPTLPPCEALPPYLFAGRPGLAA